MSTLRDHMSEKDRQAMTTEKGQPIPTWHTTCMEKTGVARPGKTARDRARGTIR
jgi:hypothetical protein